MTMRDCGRANSSTRDSCSRLASQALTIPSSAVQRGPNGLFAWVVTAGGTAEMRPLRVGPTSGDQTVVVSGLAEGDRVVTGGQYRLQQNAPVAVSAPQSSGAGNAS